MDKWEYFQNLVTTPVCLAPMAEVNDLTFRTLVRRHGVSLCYTGMLNVNQWVMSKRYRKSIFTTNQDDRPLACQIAGSDPEKLLEAGKSLAQFCDYVDLNLGCTQGIAQRGGYGIYSIDTPEKREVMLQTIRRMSYEVPTPISAKIRLLQNEKGELDVECTREFAQQLQMAGISMLQLHGRSEYRSKAASVSIDAMKSVIEPLDIPVIANGGIMNLTDVNRVMNQTGAAAVAVGQALLHCPTAFDPNESIPRSKRVFELLDLARDLGASFVYTKKQIFNLYVNDLRDDSDVPRIIGDTHALDDLKSACSRIEGIEVET